MVAASRRVLIADDESQLLRVLVRVLEKQGYSVESATDGKAALDALRAASPPIDAIVLDAAIGPEGAGPLLEWLAAEQPRVRVIATSGDQLPTPLRSQLLACDGVFLLKPFAPSALIDAIEESIANGSAR